MKKRMTEIDINSGIEEINKIYSEIPDTKGCLKYIETPKEQGGCEGKCCLHQNPSVLYIEFMNTWKHVMSEYDMDQILGLIERAVRNYLSDMPTKGCVFFDRDKKVCTQHKTRPYNCRMYSQIPDEEFKPRYEALKVLQEKDFRTVVMPQCDLTETVGDKPTKEQSDDWWNRLKKIEKDCGIPEEQITDDQNGTYRTFHDHIVLHIFPDWALEQLTQLKISGSLQEKEVATLKLIDWFKNFMNKNSDKIVSDMKSSKDKIEKTKAQESELQEEIKKLKKS